KDLPFLARALDDQPVRFALLKGWRNYVCLARLETATTAEATLFDDGMREEVAAIAAWTSRTSDGSLSDLPTQPRNEVWDEVAAGLTTWLFAQSDTVLDASAVPTLRLNDEFATHRIWDSGLRIAMQDSIGALGILRDGLQMVRERIESNVKLEEGTAALLSEV